MLQRLFSQIGPEDWFEIALHYANSLRLLLLISFCMATVVVLINRKSKGRLPWSLSLGLIILPLVVWFFYVVATAKRTFTMTLLASENDTLAEIAYQDLVKNQVSSLSDAVNLAADGHQHPNVRFYAACLVADLLITNEENITKTTLRKVDAAPIIVTDFFGTNSLNCDFYIPGRLQPRIPVRDVIEKRLGRLKSESKKVNP